jgi:hypothetical protein
MARRPDDLAGHPLPPHWSGVFVSTSNWAVASREAFAHPPPKPTPSPRRKAVAHLASVSLPLVEVLPMDWSALWPDLAMLVAGAIVVGCAVLATRIVLTIYRRLPAEQQQALQFVAATAVQYVEQVLPAEARHEKKAQAMTWAQHQLDRLGIPVDAYTLEGAIEAAVYAELRHVTTKPAEISASPVSTPPPVTQWAAARREVPRRSRKPPPAES